jgi:predicted nucleotidyltransferase
MERADQKPSRLTDVLSTLRSESVALREKGIVHAFVFGSIARGDDHALSDVDIAIEAAPFVGSPAVMEIEEILSARLGLPVQIISKRGLRSPQHSSILREMIEVF